MSAPSKTVQAAQRLLAEREAVGVRKYGATVDRTDLAAGDWLQHAIEEASDLLLYLIRLRETMLPAPAAAPEDAERRFGPITSDPADAERNLRAKEDAERAAYLARWKGAPAEATHLAQDPDGKCWWHDEEPEQSENGEWFGGCFCSADYDLLGSTRCEPRPRQGEGL